MNYERFFYFLRLVICFFLLPVVTLFLFRLVFVRSEQDFIISIIFSTLLYFAAPMGKA